MSETPETLAPQGPASAAPAAESLADIVRELRRDADIVEERHYEDTWDGFEAAGIYRDLADRIEAAAKQEAIDAEIKWTRIGYDERKAEEKRTPGNAAALREALEEALAYCESDQKSGIAYSDNDVLVPILRAALSAPPRNCDVGTAEEQLDRWESFCNRNWNTNNASRGLDPCDDCELVEFGNCRCQFLWAQMPFAPMKENGENKQ